MIKSIVTEYEDISAFSGAPAQARHHLIFGSALRKLADEDNLWIPLTNAEHNMSPHGLLYQIHSNPTAEKLSKMLGQMAWEKNAIYQTGCNPAEARQFFRNRYGISYL
jgi:hypothetical protein